ncbi:hypothetical protein AQI88_35340 [Streptomyces cellostaticus]|uniref:PknH-like extracellular domain-containing protein n=1 Tax=Streptomyces cellostaticus TaxID=67285 RepID=A0A124HBM3_9ACTN|nr:hypothetical protein [Streptomyces cellostaticus]KUM91701.1 hypothetical protein AQI88_35340 [Streptomyces cellostaticus]GHI04167.1 hypothetical protein Scel_24880 [Streptomyces cellostaticus]
MHLPSRALKVLAVAALPLALAACSSGSTDSSADKSASAEPAKAKDPNAGLLTGTQLKKALAPESYFPSGLALDASLSRDTGDSYQTPATKSAAKPHCADLDATSWIGLTGIDGVSFAQNSHINKSASAELDQEIDVYRGSASADVMKGLAKVVAACRSYPDPDTNSKVTVTGASTTGLGDEAYAITLTDSSWENGTTLIAARVGTAVVSVLSTDGGDNGAASAKKLAAQVVTSVKAESGTAHQS